MGYYIKDYTSGKIIGPFKTELQVCHYLHKHPEVLISFNCYLKRDTPNAIGQTEIEWTGWVYNTYKEKYKGL